MVDIRGRDQESLAMRVTTARTVVIPRLARAGVASRLIQKETQLMDTHSTEGIMVCIK